MRKSQLLLFCCIFAVFGLHAQAVRTDYSLPTKLQLKKANPDWEPQTAYWAKTPTSASTEEVKSLLYVQPARKDSVNLMLPTLKEKKVDMRLRAGGKPRNLMLPE